MTTKQSTFSASAIPEKSRMLLISFALVLLGAFGFVSSAIAGQFFERSGVAIDGYDAVAYFTEAKAVKGKKAYSASYKDSVFHFASEKNRDMFSASPEKYAPQFNGFCAYGVAQGAKAKIEGKNFTVLDGKLYLNYNDSVQATWLKDTGGYLKQAEKNWPNLQ